jgi:hypothetical protein
MRDDERAALEALERAWGLRTDEVTPKPKSASTKTDEGEPEDGRAPPKFLLVPLTEQEEYGLPPPPTFWETVPLTIVVSVVAALATVVMFLAATHHNH